MFRTNSNYLKTHDRYLHQGQEMDNEVKGEGNSVNYSFRMHDPRLGRFFAIDPLFSNYPKITPYSYAGNSPILYIDLQGKGPINPLTGQGTIVTAWSVADWEVLEIDEKAKEKKYWDVNLFRSASWNRESYEDETSWGDDYPRYEKRTFVGKAKDYETILYNNAGVNEKTKGLMQEASSSEYLTNHSSNFKRLERAAKSGNYIYGEENGNTYKITTVRNQWIKEQASFTKGNDGNWRISSKTNYEFSNFRKETVTQTKVIDRYGHTIKFKVTNTYYDVKETKTTYDNEGKETVTVTTTSVKL